MRLKASPKVSSCLSRALLTFQRNVLLVQNNFHMITNVCARTLTRLRDASYTECIWKEGVVEKGIFGDSYLKRLWGLTKVPEELPIVSGCFPRVAVT